MTNIGPQFFTEEELKQFPFRHLGKNVKIHSRVNFVKVENMSIGDNTRIDGHVTITATGPVNIGAHIHIGFGTYIAGAGGVEIEDFANISQGVRIYTVSDDYSGRAMTNPTLPEEYTDMTIGKVVLKKHVIVGSGSVILPNVTVETGCAIGALTLVKKSTDPWGIYAGTPARRIAERSKDLLALEEKFLSQKS